VDAFRVGANVEELGPLRVVEPRRIERPGNMRLAAKAKLDLRANLFNAFNLLNLPPFQPVTDQVNVDFVERFGRAPFGLAGRVIELQARFSF